MGTFIAPMMTWLWVYDGQVDATGKMISLHAEDPDFVVAGKTAKYKDVTEFKSDDPRVLTSHILGDDGQRHCIMTTHYHRKKKAYIKGKPTGRPWGIKRAQLTAMYAIHPHPLPLFPSVRPLAVRPIITMNISSSVYRGR